MTRTHKRRAEPSSHLPTVEGPGEKFSDTQRTDQKISAAATDLLGEGTKIQSTWEKTPQGDDYLSEVVITAADGKSLALANKKKTILTELRTRLSGADFNAQVDLSADQIRFKRKVPLPAVVVPPAEHPALVTEPEGYKQFEVPLALDPDGKQARWRPSQDGNLLLVGRAGSGVSVVTHGVIQALAQAGWRVWLVAGNGIEFTGYQGYPNVEFLPDRLDKQLQLIKLAHGVVEHRLELLRTKQMNPEDLDPIALVLDRPYDLGKTFAHRGMSLSPKTSDDYRSSVLSLVRALMAALSRQGRAAKVHLIYGTQRPNGEPLGSESLDNFTSRMSMGSLVSWEASAMMWGDGAIGQRVPEIGGRGIGLVDGAPAQVQAAYTANPDEASSDHDSTMVAAQRPRTRLHSLKFFSDAEGRDSDLNLTWPKIPAELIVDEKGQTTKFDPVSSEESRALRASASSRSRDTGERRLQTANSVDEAMALFAADTTEGVH